MMYSEVYRIRNYETDQRGFLTLFSLANYLQDTANLHAIKLGVGMISLADQGLSWVLHRMSISIRRWPRISEEIIVETHPSGLEKVFVYRDFRVYDPDRNLLLTATSTWLVFDTTARTLVLPGVHFETIFDPFREFEFLPRPTRKFAARKEQAEESIQIQARYNEIDANAHVNNSSYFQWFLEPLPDAFIGNHTCIEIDILFKKECTRADKVSSLYWKASEGGFLHQLLNEEGKEVAIGMTYWTSPS
jgi:medium-chain acyl-[acyl-carrier-protein] hydrolase